jgi:hypothetical protein
MATNNACNFALGTTGQVLTMTSNTAMAFANPSNRSQTSPSRSLNTIFQVSTTQDSLVNYSININCTLSLTGGQTGTVILEMATNSAFTTGVQTLSTFVNGNTGTLTIGLNITQIYGTNIIGYVPAGNFVRIRTVNTTGTPTFNFTQGQEVLL